MRQRERVRAAIRNGCPEATSRSNSWHHTHVSKDTSVVCPIPSTKVVIFFPQHPRTHLCSPLHGHYGHSVIQVLPISVETLERGSRWKKQKMRLLWHARCCRFRHAPGCFHQLEMALGDKLTQATRGLQPESGAYQSILKLHLGFQSNSQREAEARPTLSLSLSLPLSILLAFRRLMSIPTRQPAST